MHRFVPIAIVCSFLAASIPEAATARARATCMGERATIIGTSERDRLRGTSGDDVIAGLGGRDTIDGRGGNDLICGNGGRDGLSGGRGDDRLFGQASDDGLVGDRGSDIERGGGGFDALAVTDDPGNDDLSAGPDFEYLHFGNATSPVEVNLEEGFVRGEGFGTDTVDDSFEIIYGSQYSDQISGDANDNILFGGFDSPGDEITGGDGNDYIEGYESNDSIHGEGGDDVLVGGFGKDTIDGGDGSDMASYVGRFSFTACTPNCAVTADLTEGTSRGYGTDALISIENLEGTDDSGADRGDVLIGDDGHNILIGNGGKDSLQGASGNDQLFGGAGGDSLDAGDGDDSLYGDDVRAQVYEPGRPGPDALDGGDGDDFLDGGQARDECRNGETVRNCEA
jgi:Ca2+-binding RTX toxin-like protein